MMLIILLKLLDEGGRKIMNKKILNLGSGYDKIPKTISIDIRPETKPNIVLDLEKDKLPFRDDSVDEIIMNEFLEHIKNISHALKECYRVLKPKGLVKITVPYHGKLQNIWFSLFLFEYVFDPLGDHIRFFTPGSLEITLRTHGLKVKKMELTNTRFWFFHEHILVEAIKS